MAASRRRLQSRHLLMPYPVADPADLAVTGRRIVTPEGGRFDSEALLAR